MDFDKGNCVIKIRVGKLNYENKLLTPSPEKGNLSIFLTEEGMITVQWKRTDVTYIDTEMILFPGDAICQLIKDKDCGYIQIKETKRTFFFWNQETKKEDFYKSIDLIQKVLNGEEIQSFNSSIPQQIQPIYKFEHGMWTIADVSLKKILDPKIIEKILKEHPEEIEHLKVFCPVEETRNKSNEELIPIIIENIRSDQFQETLRLIETAIHTGEGDSIIQQLGAELHHQGFGGLRLILRDLIEKNKK